jgi:hypothetical protein
VYCSPLYGSRVSSHGSDAQIASPNWPKYLPRILRANNNVVFTSTVTGSRSECQ